MFLLYNFLITLLAPLWVPWMLLRAARRKEAVNWAERQGKFASLPAKAKGVRRLWVHAVSVGEVVAALPLLRELRATMPKHEIVLTVTTSSGHQTAREQAQGLYDHLLYFPMDVARFQLGAMQQVRPEAVIIMETELWFNFLWAAKVFEARTILVNGRISDRSYPRSKKLGFFYRGLLMYLDRALVQSPTDAERLGTLGAANVEVIGNLKFDQALQNTQADAAKWRAELGLDADKPVVVVGSLRHEEFASVAPSLRQLAVQGVQIVVAPRHLERTDALIAALGTSAARRSSGERLRDNLLILDTYGELAEVYAAADVAVIGGGFAELGGQNLIQPLALGIPVVHGPHMRNFRDVSELARREGATVTATADELVAKVTPLLADPETRRKMGDSARALVRVHAGASARYAAIIKREADLGEQAQRPRKMKK